MAHRTAGENGVSGLVGGDTACLPLPQALAELLPHIVWITGPGGQVIYLNRRWTEFTGATLEQTLEAGWNSFLHPDDVAAARLAGETATENQQHYEVEFRVRGADGAYRWFLSRGTAVPGDDGKLAFWTGTCTDIEVQKRAQDAERFVLDVLARARGLDEPERILSMVLEALGEYLGVSRCHYAGIDSSGGTIAVHADFCRGAASHVGTYPLGKLGRELVSSLAEGTTIVCSDVLADARTIDRLDEVYRPLEIGSFISAPIILGGSLAGALSVHCVGAREWTQTEIRLVENLATQSWLAHANAQSARQLRATNALLDNLLDAAPVGFGCFNEALEYVRVNDALARINGIAAQEHIGQRAGQLLGPLGAEAEQDVAEVFATGRTIAAKEVTGWTPAAPDEDRAWITSYYPIHSSESIIDGVGVVVVEITERKRHEAHIQMLRERLQHSVTETHHRVKNNLQLMSAMVDMRLLDGGETFTAQELRQLNLHIRTLAVVHDLLTQNAKEAGTGSTVCAGTLLRRLVELTRQTNPGCTVTGQFAEVQLPAKQATSLALILNELMSNAVKHGRSLVDATLEAPDGSVALHVCDDGTGFPADFQAEQTTSTGLELVLNLTRLDLCGIASFTNLPRGGACVSIRFPLPQATP